MNKSLIALALLLTAGCMQDHLTDKAVQAPMTATSFKEPIRPVTADDINAANARSTADQLRGELEQARGTAVKP